MGKRMSVSFKKYTPWPMHWPYETLKLRWHVLLYKWKQLGLEHSILCVLTKWISSTYCPSISSLQVKDQFQIAGTGVYNGTKMSPADYRLLTFIPWTHCSIYQNLVRYFYFRLFVLAVMKRLGQEPRLGLVQRQTHNTLFVISKPLSFNPDVIEPINQKPKPHHLASAPLPYF